MQLLFLALHGRVTGSWNIGILAEIRDVQSDYYSAASNIDPVSGQAFNPFMAAVI